MGENFNVVTFGDPAEKGRRQELVNLLKACPIPDDELLLNLGLFLTPQTLSRVLFMHHLYQQIVAVQGVVIEFGCRWGQSLALFAALRGIYEPFNRLRKIIGFDTFQGFRRVSPKDGSKLLQGAYSVPPDYPRYLDQVLSLQEKESPLGHLRKYEIVQGDAEETLVKYLERNPETIVALAYFDFDLYEPTKKCLALIKDRLTRGSILGFDEVNDPACPGETLALQETFGLGTLAVRRYPQSARTSYVVMDR
jgi:hypothetical protein